MKRSLATMMTFLFLMGMLAGGTIIWLFRGRLPGSTQPAAAPPTAEISRPGSNPAASPTSPSPTGVNVVESNTLAAQLLQEVLNGSTDEERVELLKVRFRSAVAGCDEAAVAEMLETLSSDGKDPADPDGVYLTLPGQCRGMLAIRMAALNPWKALQSLVGFEQYNLSCPPSAFVPALEPLSASALVQAQAVIEKLPPGKTRTWAELAWLQASVKYDPEAVFQNLMNLDSDTRKSLGTHQDALRELLSKLALQAPEKALQAAALFPDDRVFEIKYDLVPRWLKRDPKAAVKWALEQNDAQTLRIYLRFLPSENHALDEKSLRNNFLTINAKKPEDRVDLASILAAHLAEQDIPESVRWAATLPADARKGANAAVANAWIKQDAPAAAEWLATWPAGSAKDEAVEALTEAIVADDPESALAWAASIQTKRRFSLMQKFLDRLTGKDPAAAERAMQTLSEEDRAVLSVMKRTGLGE